jgi:hypothetical protein
MVGGAKNTEGDALDERVTEDSDPNSETYVDYTALGTGNGRRIIGVPINGGPPAFTAVGIGMFFLQPTPNYQSIGEIRPSARNMLALTSKAACMPERALPPPPAIPADTL